MADKSARQFSPWPPVDGVAFLHCEAFGRLLVEVANDYARRYPALDFSDAVAHAFVSFDQRLARESGFISGGRFPRFSAFLAYVRQIVWNAGLLAQRQQARDRRLSEVVPPAFQQASSVSAERLAEIHEAVERLSEPYRSIIERVILGDEDLETVASAIGVDPDRSGRLFIDALDLLSDEASR